MNQPTCVADLCQKTVITTHEEATVRDAAGLMRQHHVGSLVVTRGQPARIVGMLTDRDIAIVAVARDFDPLTLRVADVMTDQVHSVAGRSAAEQALQLMRKHGVRRLPVTDENGCLSDILSLDDLLDTVVGQLATLVQALQREHARERQLRV